MKWRIASAAALLLLAGAIGTLSAQQGSSAETLPPGPGLELIQRSCIGCHDIYVVIQKRKTPEEWATTLGLMADRGAEVTPDEMKVIENYLVHNFATRNTP